MRPRRRSFLVALVVSAVAVAGCAAAGQPGSDVAGSTVESPSGEVTVFAAASLTESFAAMAEPFSTAHPGVEVVLNVGASSSLAQQIVSGAPADVFASANPATMATVVDADLNDGTPTVFARNRLIIAVPAGNPAGVTGLADLADESLTIALCAPEVPCGAAAEKAFAAGGLTPAPDTLEQDVKAALTKVELGEVDAALVYRTDVQAAGDTVQGIEFDEASETVNDYQVVVVAESPNSAAAQAFVSYVLSTEGQAVLGDAGFDQP